MKQDLYYRDEPWGRITYRQSTDEFSAEVKNDADPIPTTPIGIGWVIIGGCNLKCIHCYGNAEELPKIVLSTADCMRIVDRIAEAKVMRVVISGGEPLLRGDTFDIIGALSENDVSVVLGTNGAFIERENVEWLRTCTRVEVSLDASTREKNNHIRPSRQKHGDAWLETMRAIELCLKYGVRLRVLTAVNAWNQHDLVEMAALLQSRGVTDWAVSWTIPAGRARRDFERLRPETATVEMQIETARRVHPSLTIRYSNRTVAHNRFYCLILPDGQMATEDLGLSKKIAFGSVIDTPIVDMWRQDHYNLPQHFEKWVAGRVRTV